MKNPIVTTIESLFSNELAGNKYSKYSKDDLVDLIEKKFSEAIKGTDVNFVRSQKLVKKMKKASDVSAILSILNEAMFGL